MTMDRTVFDAERRHESPDVGAAAARLMRALAQRSSEGDTQALEQLAALEQLTPMAVQLAGHRLHVWGYSFTELASVLGISRQAARARFTAVPLSADTPHSWPMDWLSKNTSSASVLRMIVAQLAERRAS